MKTTTRMTRRVFLRRCAVSAGVVLAGPHVIGSSALGRDGTVAPSERITLAVVGFGARNRSNLPNYLAQKAEGRAVRGCARLLMKNGDKGVRFDCDEGWIHLSDGGEITAEPKSILSGRYVPKVSWSFMTGHVRNFLNCIKSRKLTAAHPELAHRAHTIIHCANISLRLGRKVRWDSKTERFTGDDQSNRMLQRVLRPPWRL